MRSALRRTTLIILLTIFLVPGVLQARTPVWSFNRVSASSPEVFLNKVWNLLTFWRGDSGTGAVSAMSKNGCGLDPAGQPLPCDNPGSGTTSTSGSGDNGCGLDPAGHPCP